MIAAGILSFIQFILTMVAQIWFNVLLTDADSFYRNPYFNYSRAQSITQMFISPIVGITLTLWSLKQRQIGISSNINNYS